MSEYLDRKQVIELYEKHHSHLATYVCEFGQELRQLPIVEQRPHGEWIKERLQIDERHFRSFAKCKVCGCEFKPYSFAVKEFDFCPKCGADMRKEGEEQ